MDEEARLQQIARLLAPPDRPPDRAFAQRVRLAIIAEEGHRRARRRAWLQFRYELAAALAVAAVCLVVWWASLGQLPAGSARHWSGAEVCAFIVILWIGVATVPRQRAW
jgi:hypothetical protein